MLAVRFHGHVIGYAYAIDLDYCKGCGLYAQACPCGAIEMEREEV